MGSVSADSTKTRLHFSDGILEIDDDPCVKETAAETSQALMTDPKSMMWGPWAAYMTAQAGTKTLQVFDYIGESLASILGITTPKYHFEINEYNRRKEAEQRERDEEMGSWTSKKTEKVAEVAPKRY